ncbi:MAG: hypothetical protein A2031_03730 [Deltaproteobacteria bacterium RBG_19FT_COMBO_43_11]|nr:MAG: hypothetical protein A2W27_07420 [Deltaproteobacteria bacterium RBG_16_44_11]OGP90784.1 MAG: hypothetical protein A2031_03730 [Deltaproteobacteria bacterium RBG_19FT_COMBO_43_11]
MGSAFESAIDQFADEYVNVYPVSFPEDPGKVIHDALWGTQHLKPYEVAVLNTPLLQRLRGIKQTAFSYLIFPSATHSRFEHTLGVLYQSNQLLTALCKTPKYQKILKDKIDLVRMAALLHDCGHGPFSHSTEEIYNFFPDMQSLIGPGGKHEGWNAHELLSYYIVKSAPFKNFFKKVLKQYNISIDIDLAADLIVGGVTNPLLKFVQDIINGPFDSDKIDYIFRDGHFSGLPLQIDLDRLWYSVQIADIKRPAKKTLKMLIMSINGMVPLEQILFSKMVLFTSLYQHHKVRACDCMLKAIIGYAKRNDQKIGKRDLSKTTNFLWLTDGRIYAEADLRKKNDPLHKLIHDLKFRRLLKRALIISKTTVKDGSSKDLFEYSTLKRFCNESYAKDPELRKLAKKIWEDAGRPCRLEQIWVDLPKTPPTGTADDTYINKGTFRKPDYVTLKDVFRVDDWAHNYVEHNWRGHVFCFDDKNVRKKVAISAQKILEEEFNVKFNNSAIKLCKI